VLMQYSAYHAANPALIRTSTGRPTISPAWRWARWRRMSS
jgi:hypothetical protein